MKLIKTIAVIENEPINLWEDGSVTFRAKAAIDCDGIGKHYGDPYAQNDTSLHWKGHALNADLDKYIVVPPAIIRGVKGIVLGCAAHVVNLKNSKETEAVVGDIGPAKKLGEISVACARALGIDPSPTRGGMEEHDVSYILLPGIVAKVDGKQYELKPS